MNRLCYLITLLLAASALTLAACSGVMGDETASENELACLALTNVANLTLTSAELVPASESPTSPTFRIRQEHPLSMPGGNSMWMM